MIKHIIMFKIEEYESEEDKLKKAHEIKSTFEVLKDNIKEIFSYQVGLNFNTSNCAFDVVIDATFRNREELQTYLNHPDHIFAREKISMISKTKAVIDYEIKRKRKKKFGK